MDVFCVGKKKIVRFRARFPEQISRLAVHDVLAGISPPPPTVEPQQINFHQRPSGVSAEFSFIFIPNVGQYTHFVRVRFDEPTTKYWRKPTVRRPHKITFSRGSKLNNINRLVATNEFILMTAGRCCVPTCVCG